MVAFPFSRSHQIVHKPLGINYNDNPVTIGEKIRNKRLELRLLQKDIAHILSVSEDCITNWENNRTAPETRYMPAIISFLGYSPFPVNNEVFSARVKYYRQTNGLTHKQMGKLLGVNASTVGSWESDEHRPQTKRLNQIDKKLKKLSVV